MEIKPIIRKATKEDLRQFERNKADEVEARKICQEESDRLDLKMNVISAEYTLDRAKITFIYLADERVDFRELLKVLASIFHCRIDLRQIGTRDKAKMVSGVGVCGRELCCAKFIGDFDRISINMAKNQLLALNIQKLSGQCGNLMCCLRFEDDAYKELRKDLPKLNSQVEYDGERFRVTSMNVITKNCKLENPDHAIYISLEDLVKKGKYNRKTVKNESEEESVAE
jgi:cell fate regulator YaaT (PSP1 superfamily)